jgi:voltage-gated potassium channel Kch
MPENVIDLLSIIPFYAYIALNETKEIKTVKNIARILRSFSILKIFRTLKSMRTLGKTLISSYKELLLLVSYLFLGVLVFSSVIFYFESGENDTEFTSIPAAMWWGVITMTTVGYGGKKIIYKIILY